MPIEQPPLETSAFASPLPLSATSRSAGDASVLTLSRPGALPSACGTNVTVTVHSAPACKVNGALGQVLFCIANGPLTTMPVTRTTPEPLLDSVTSVGTDCVPMRMASKLSAVADTARPGLGPPRPLPPS